ncbi:hypothetical protein HPB47_008547 [Ixodes persulcatus]|uniref:Uncharacterized protein n=1 Tax=Ixodes persulcatus TaxID=34615 RepID=A0AC60P4F7_IXOPE|nr:hypothetical protein HPB47_008547 [Ixodes persulcatus]
MKVHWVPTSVPDANVASAFSTFGKIKSIVRDKWHYSGFEDVETTTRILSIELNEGVTADSLPHQLRILGTTVLVSVPGRAPQCLRCRQVGHVRGQCRAPWCSACRKFGHDLEDCVPTYANRTTASLQIPADYLMDAEETAQTEVSREVSTAHKTAYVEAASRTEKCEDRSASSCSATKETVSKIVITNSFSALVPEDQAEEPRKPEEEASEMDETSDKEMLGKRKGEGILCTVDPGSTSQWERAESKRRRKRRTKSLSPKSPITVQDSILSGQEDLKSQ